MLFNFLNTLDTFFWGYVAFLLILFFGLYLTLKHRFYQLREAPAIARTFFQLVGSQKGSKKGIHPLKAFFASAGGMIGIGNIVGIVTAVQLGGPGALFWVWIAGIFGAIVKYGEIYLGFKYREENSQGGYDGGPMYFLRAAFKGRFLPVLVAILLCVYGVEIYQFSVITDSVSLNWGLNRTLVIAALLSLVLFASVGGVKRLGQICSWIMPIFLIAYLGMSLWILFQEGSALPGILLTVLKSAFTGHAAIGGFVGSSMVMAIQYGIARAAYSGDIGVGYDSIIQSESNTVYPEQQARLAIFGVFIDNLICTLSILVVLASGLWKVSLEGSELIQSAFASYFPHMQLFMPLFLALCGYTTIIAYFVVGIKCARYLSPKYGAKIYPVYGAITLILFTFVEQKQALLIMSLTGASLLIINLLGIFRLRKEIRFSEPSQEISFV